MSLVLQYSYIRSKSIYFPIWDRRCVDEMEKSAVKNTEYHQQRRVLLYEQSVNIYLFLNQILS